MSYELIGESIKSAISVKLGQLFNNPIRYKENITNPQYPNFYIVQVSCNVTPMQTKYESALKKDLKRVKLDYLMNIKYRVAHDTETITNLRQQLDAVGIVLLAEFTEIDLERPVYTKNCRYEIVDGVLQFFCNLTVYATNYQVNDTDMETLDIEEQIEEEDG